MFSELFANFRTTLLRQITTRVGLWMTETDSQMLIFDADVSFPGRGIGLLIFLVSLLPFYSDSLWVDTNNYDFFNYGGFILIRGAIAALGLWLWLLQGKVLHCQFDKAHNKYVIEQNSYLHRQKAAGNLQDIAQCNVTQVQKSRWFPLGKSLYTHIQVTVIETSGVTTSFTFVEQRNSVDQVIDKTRNQLSDFLELTADV